MFAGIANLAFVSIPMFVLMGAAVASSPAGKDLYEALDRWLCRVPGGLILSNIGACAIFSGMTGSSPATAAAIGKMGIPEMMQRGYPASVATGSIAAGGTLGILIPPSVTMIVYGIATETSIGRLFLAGVIPGLMLTAMFMAWALFDARRRGFRFDDAGQRFSFADRIRVLPRVLPFILIIIGVMYVLYGGVATPSEAAGAGALLTLLVVFIVYRLFRARPDLEIFTSTMRESVMIMMILASAELFAFALSSLVHHPVHRLLDRRAGREPLGADGHHQSFPAGGRHVPAAGRGDRHGGAAAAADRPAGGIRSLLVRRCPDHQHGDRADHAARRAEPVRHQRDRPARCRPSRCSGVPCPMWS